jgi:hypothetical protein
VGKDMNQNDKPERLSTFEPYVSAAAGQAVSRFWFLHGRFDNWVESPLTRAAISQPIAVLGKLIENVPEKAADKLSLIREGLPSLKNIRDFVVREARGIGTVSVGFVETLQEINHALLIIAFSSHTSERLRSYIFDLKPADFPEGIRGKLLDDITTNEMSTSANLILCPTTAEILARPYFRQETTMFKRKQPKVTAEVA